MWRAATVLGCAVAVLAAILTGTLVSRVWNAIPGGRAMDRWVEVFECVQESTKEEDNGRVSEVVVDLCVEAYD